MNFKNTRERRLRIIKAKIAKNNDRHFYIYGCGKTGFLLYALCKKFNVPIYAFVVDDAWYTVQKIDNISVMKSSEFYSLVAKRDFVWICIDNIVQVNRISDNLKARCSEIFHCVFPLSAYRSNIYLDYSFYKKNKLKYLETYKKLSDSISKKVFNAFLSGCICGNPRRINNTIHNTRERQYFCDLTLHKHITSFLDIGAYTGDTIGDVLKIYNGIIRNIICFEPDQENLKQLHNTVEGYKELCNFHIVEKGAWSDKETLYFVPDAEGSAVTQNAGVYKIEVDSIDNVLDSYPTIPVDFIKMDIEGSELCALIGAEKTIRKFRPILAICVYHKPEDLYSIPEFITDLGLGYKFYLRNHGLNLRELVLYAIPYDKIK